MNHKSFLWRKVVGSACFSTVFNKLRMTWFVNCALLWFKKCFNAYKVLVYVLWSLSHMYKYETFPVNGIQSIHQNLLGVCITTSPAGKRPISQQPIASGRLHHTAQTTGANRAAFVWHNVPLCFFTVGQHLFYFFYKVSFYNPNWNVHNVLVNWCHYKTLAILGCLPDRCTMLLQLTYNTFFWKILYNVSFGPHRFTSLRVEGALCWPLKGIYVLKQKKKIWKLTDGNWASCGKMVKNICVEIF